MVRKARKRRQGRSSGAAPAVGDAAHNGGGRSSSSDAAPYSPPKSDICRIVDKLGHAGVILLLFETPSGFAIFRFDGAQLYLPNAKENIWTFFAKDSMARDLRNDRFKYDGTLLKTTCVTIYSEMASAREILADTVKKLKLWATETNEASEEPESSGAPTKQETL